MKIPKLLFFLIVFLPQVGWSAIEYLRFEGEVYRNYSLPNYGWHEGENYYPELNLHAGQSVFFDFEVDTENVLNNELPYFVPFQSSYLGGSVESNDSVYGSTTLFPEGVASTLGITSGKLWVGIGWNTLNDLGSNPTLDISTWGVGSWVSLLSSDVYGYELTLANLVLTERSSTPLPALTVPIISAGPLFLSSLVFLLSYRRLTSSFTGSRSCYATTAKHGVRVTNVRS